MGELDASNLINIGILIVTGLVGILSWLGSRNAAREARQDQEAATGAASRSASAAVEANKLHARMVEIEEERQEREALNQKKAELVARLERAAKVHGKPVNHWDLVVSNRRDGTARNIQVKLRDKPFELMVSADLLPSESHVSIGPGGEVKRPLPGTPEFRPPFPCELSWDDDSAVPRKWRSTLT